MHFRRTQFCLSVSLTLLAVVSALSQLTIATTPSSKPAPPGKDLIALFNAVDRGDTAKVQALLDGGVSACAQAPNGLTPLTLASMMNHPSVVRLLLDRGADVNAALRLDGYIGGETALISAAGGSMNIMAGADVNAYNGFGRTAITLARSNRHGDVVTLLQRSGAKDLPEGPHAGVTLKKIGQEPNGDAETQVTMTPRPADQPVDKK